MSEKRPSQEPVPNGASFKRQFLRLGKHIALIHLPETYHAPIGLVIAYWGQFEILFDGCLAALIDAEAQDGVVRDTRGWTTSEFRRRRELFKAICSEWLETWQPEAGKALSRICDTSGDLRWKRDMIAHGRFVYTIPPNSAVAVNCRALNERTGEKMPFDEHSLAKLHHDLAHLTADLALAFRQIGGLELPFPLVPDTQLLQVFRETSRRSRARQDMPQPPHQSEQE